jgi:hypothetical protein
MPSRIVSLAILVYWLVAAFLLLTRDLLPELSLGYPPDLRTIAAAGQDARPARWTIQVVDDPATPEIRRNVGEAVTSSTRRQDGWHELNSIVWFDSGDLLQGTPFRSRDSVRLDVNSNYRVDPKGNLRHFEVKVRSRDPQEELFTVTGTLKGDQMEVVARGPLPILNQTRTFPYAPRGVVNNLLGPLDRLPGLHVGQRWDSRVVNPFSGQVDLVRVEVVRRTLIHWNNNPLSVFEVVQSMPPFSARSWVQTDGLIIRQEVPFPFVRLLLERVPDPPETPPLDRRPPA